MYIKLMHLQLILLMAAISVEASKILMFPIPMFKTSDLRNMEKLSAILVEHGHEIHFLMDDWYTLPELLKESEVKLITFPRPSGDQYPPPTYQVTVAESIVLGISYIPGGISGEYANTLANSVIDNCDSLISSTNVLDQLKQENYELFIFASFFNPCKRLLSSYLRDIPTIELFTMGSLLRFENRDYPLSLSYFPMVLTSYAPDMSFVERVNNFVFTFLYLGVIKSLDLMVDAIAVKHGIEIQELHGLHLVFGGFPIEYPAPNTPDVAYINDLLISKPEPLEQELESFMQSSGDHGVVIMSFGSMVREYGDYYSELFAEALSKIPQKVVWKYDGPLPRKLANNTKFMKWLPQTGLLAHPKTKVFITHCGINSAYESMYYGVPILGLPLFYDQPSNCARFARHHKAGIQLDLNTITVEQLVNSFQEIISTPKYRENVEQLGALLRDHPMSGKDVLLYWVDYVVRHKGVEHLKPYGRLLSWYQFYLIDVISFLLLILAVIISFSICGCKILYKKCLGGFVSKIKKE